MSRCWMVLWLALLAAGCATGGGSPGYGYRSADEDPLGCFATDDCTAHGRCSSVLGFCHAWHTEDCQRSQDCANLGTCCYKGNPECNRCE